MKHLLDTILGVESDEEPKPWEPTGLFVITVVVALVVMAGVVNIFAKMAVSVANAF